MSAEELLARCAGERDEQAWRELLRRFRPPMLGGIRRGLRRAGPVAEQVEAEDLLQEVYCRLLDRGCRTLRRCRGNADRVVATYLARVAERVVLDRVRHLTAAKRWPQRRVIRAAPTAPPEEGSTDAETPSPAPTPEELLLLREDLGRSFSRIRSLVDGRRRRRDLRVVEMALVQGMSSKEIAARLGGELQPASIDSLLYRLRQRLAAQGVSLSRP